MSIATVTNPTLLVSHYFWLRFWQEHQDSLHDMNEKRNESDRFWTYPSTLSEFRRAFPVCPVCGGDGIQLFGPHKLNKHVTLDSTYCVCKMVEFLSKPPSKYESRVVRPFTFEQFEFNVEPVALRDDDGKPVRLMKDTIPLLEKWTRAPFSWLYLWGGVGSGKSSAMAAIKQRLGNLAFYITAPALQVLVFGSLQSQNMSPQDVQDLLASAPILMIDDLGHEYQKGDFTQSVIAAVIDRRYSHGRLAPVVVSSNIPPEEFLQTTNSYMGRAADRILDTNISHTVFFNQRSYRTGR